MRFQLKVVFSSIKIQNMLYRLFNFILTFSVSSSMGFICFFLFTLVKFNKGNSTGESSEGWVVVLSSQPGIIYIIGKLSKTSIRGGVPHLRFQGYGNLKGDLKK